MSANLGIRLDHQRARIEPNRESLVIQIHVCAGGEGKRNIGKLVKVTFHEGISVQIHDRLERSRLSIRSPNPQFCIPVQEPQIQVLPSIGRGYEFHRQKFPFGGLNSAEGVVITFSERWITILRAEVEVLDVE